ncbi:tetratricopeptide repeat protein [Magnetospirillum sp. SS-4]|uniref:tetratricopeptide repeat protein n=1 Tax=Magnetospirillum sp. SS-4 TaxID=2681465 RepID=UPI00137EA698|nr:tetratricopeptide repeat protein [Magnetospirillum sp. SS-4]CAA7620156.1 TPR repeat-containing protein (modular protein) [Magnetospirillum sp. SS-4]
MTEVTVTVDQAFQHGVDLHRRGAMPEAEAVYRQILAVAPDHLDSLHMLGLLAHQSGRSEQGVGLIRQSLAVGESGAQWCNLSVALLALGRLDEAMRAAERALALSPDLSEPCVNMGTVLERLGRPLEAAPWFALALERGGNPAELLGRQGMALEEAGRHAEALAKLDEAAAAGLDTASLHYGRGRALHETRRYGEAIPAYLRAVELDPRHASAVMNLGLVHQELKQTDQAVARLRQALDLAPGNYIVLYNLGRLYKMIGRITDAIEAARGAIASRPDFAKSYLQLGNAYHAGGQLGPALEAFRKAHALDAGDSIIHDNLLAALGCDATTTGETLLAEYRRWNAAHMAGIPRLSHANDPDPDRRLRIGYVSPDFRNHAVAYFVEPLLAARDRAAFEVFCYSMVEQEDAVTGRFKVLADHWRDILHMGDGEAAALIQADGIDILVDLVGHTVGKRMGVFARKPAPVQVATLIGHDGTTGMDVFDAMFGDPWLTPPGYEALFAEPLVRLPRVIAPFRPRDDWPDVFPLPAEGQPPVLGCFAEPSRIGDVALDLWKILLDRLPGARLLFKHPAFGVPDRAGYWRQRFGRWFGDRFDMEDVNGGWSAHMGVYGRVTVMLDTYPLTGATSTLIPLWMGVPVVSLAGTYPGRRYGATMLNNAGAPELVAENPESFIALVMALVGDRDRLDRYRRTMRATMKASPILDAGGVAAETGQACRRLWRAWCEGQGGGNVSVTPAPAAEPDPLDAEGWTRRGAALRGTRPAEALACLGRAVAAAPFNPVSHSNLAIILMGLGRVGDAIAALGTALALEPDHPEALVNLASALDMSNTSQDPELARRCIDLYRAAEPGYSDKAGLQFNLANIHKRLGQIEEARECCRRIEAMQGPCGASVRRLLLAPRVYESTEAMAGYRRELEAGLDRLQAGGLILTDPLRMVGETGFGLAYHNLNDCGVQRRLAEFYRATVPGLDYVAPHCRDPRPRTGRIRLGIVGSYRHNRTLDHLNAGLIGRLSRDRFDIVFLRPGGVADGESDAMDSLVDRVVPLVDDLDGARRAIAELELDVLFYFEIGMVSLTYFLAFSRLAPVQCVTWGHPDTTGIPAMDYFLSSHLLEPDDGDEHYTETLIRLGHLPTCYPRPPVEEVVADRSRLGVPEGAHLYVCPQNLMKFHPDFDDVLGRILTEDPDGRLLITTSAMVAWEPALRRRIAARFPHVADRIVFLPQMSRLEFMSLLAACDVNLDPFHFSGGNSTHEALALGSPVVTWPGAFMRGRVSLALYRRMGLMDLVCADPDDYVAKALRLARDPEWRSSLRAAIRERSAILFDDAAMVAEFEDFMEAALTAAARGEKVTRWPMT